MLFRLLIFSSGFLLLVFCVRVLLVLFILVELLFCISQFRSMVCEFGKRFVLVELAFCCAVFRVASNYAPNRNPDRDVFFVRCFNAIDPTVPTLLCSDFNTVLDRVVDHCGSCPFDVSRESSVMLSSLFSDCCVVHIWRELHPGVRAFTWCRPHGALGSRIDLIGCPYVWVPHVSSVDILPCPFSDQCAHGTRFVEAEFGYFGGG